MPNQQERNQMILELHQKEWSNADIARHFKLSRERISQILRKAGTSAPKSSRKKLKRIMVESILGLAEGQSADSIASINGLSPRTLRSYLNKCGLKHDSIKFQLSLINQIGREYGDWTVLMLEPFSDQSCSLIRCRATSRCKCGKIHQMVLRGLLDGLSQRCKKCSFQNRSRLAIRHKLSGVVYESLSLAAAANGMTYTVAYNLFRKGKVFIPHQEPSHIPFSH